ncbi:sensor histidine kinase [Actinomadura alba]|uniref:histidine kinase n=1 Tax=Actinomadura alba TaxID=406431 RepID=A0ABR7LTZ5_9ACTN|nr:histidine kinase [Actinomadura alba]MBC6467878.1 histidine kinase [Actinomadura alba]
MDAHAAQRRPAGPSRGRIRGLAGDRAADAGYVLAGAALGILFLLATVEESTQQQSSAPPLGLDLTVGGLTCLGLVLLRRRWAVGLALTVTLAGTLVSSMAFGVAFVAMFNVAMRRSWRVTAAVAAVHITPTVAFYHLDAATPRQYWEAVAVVVLLDATLITSGMLVRSQRLLVRSLRDRARQAEEGQRLRVEEARHLERERLAREMHDVLAHRISLLAVHAGALEFRQDAPAEETRAAGIIRQCAYEAMEDLREVIGILREDPDASDRQRPQPTLTDLPALIEESLRAGAPVTLDNRIGDLSTVSARIGRHAYRIVQEGLTNARKHSPGAGVRVTVDGTLERELTVEVRNAMSAARPAGRIPGSGTGLIGLRERVDLVGGQIEHGRTVGGDFRLHARLPWPA